MPSSKLTELIEEAASKINMVNPADLSEIEKLQNIINEIYHGIEATAKGPGSLLEQAKGTTGQAADLLQSIISDQVQETSKTIESVSEAVSTLQNLIDQIENQSEADQPEQLQTESSVSQEEKPQGSPICEEDVSLVMDFITESGEHIESAEAGLLELESKPDDGDVINQIFRAFHTIKGMAGFLDLGEIGSVAHSAENLLDLARKHELVLTGENMNLVFESIDMLKKMLAGLKGSIEAGKPVSTQTNLSELLERLAGAAQGNAISQKKESQSTKKAEEAPAIAEQLLVTENKNDEEKRSGDDRRSENERRATAAGMDEKIKVSTSRLDNLINMVGELVIAQLMVSEEANIKFASEHELRGKVVHQGKIVRELQELSMSMRMVPIAGVFQKMARLVRDLSQKAEKEINFTIRGQETELDRNIVDKIADPLVHMVRNSVDHGIENAQQRIEAGKNPAGQIELRAFHQAGNIVIEIEDDGKGLNKEKILRKAIESGIVQPSQELSDEQIFKLIFHAGLSTAEKVTSISGRGVGMDVVRKNIESLHGKIDISSIPGKGTKFAIRLPLTLAIIDGQIVKIGNDRYIIPITSIVHSLKPKAGQISTIQNKGEMVMFRGEMLKLIRLYRLFGTVPVTEDPTEALLMIVEEEGKKCCLLVDELLGQQQVVIKSLGEGLGNAKGISGGAIMGDGKVSLILDIPGLMQLAKN